MKQLSQSQIIVFVSSFLVIFYNYLFFSNVVEVYNFKDNFAFIVSIALLSIAFYVFLFTIITLRITLKPIFITLFLVSSLTSYFMNTYSVVIDDSMIRNTLQTDMKESMDLFTFKQVVYFFLLGVIPSFLLFKVDIKEQDIKSIIISKTKIIFLSLFVMLGLLFIFSKYYTSFFREHKPLRYTANPGYWIYSIGKYVNATFTSGEIIVQKIGDDASIDTTPQKKQLVIMVVGEAARADHFSLNGYEKETNPLLIKENIINFSNTYSCGTSTAESVPCMFSIYNRNDYSYKKGISTENVLDVIAHTKEVSVLWRDNNSDSKGVALRVPYQSYKSANINTICEDGECRDEGMLIGLDTYIEKNKNDNILIVLHQMGNHGPAYYKRYPKEFELFTPTCNTNQLEKCTQEEISNAYDNAILYTDYFLSQTISFLKKYDKNYETTMLYMSDHGESLGENGIYLHGLPYFMAPDAQKHIGALVWFGDSKAKNIDISSIKKSNNKEISHDNLFHTLLGLFEVQTNVYDKNLDLFRNQKKE